MINKEKIQRRFGRALGFKSKGNTKIFAIKYTGDNAYDVQEFLEQSIFIGPRYSFIKCGQDIIKKGMWVMRYPLTFKNITLNKKYSICSNRAFQRNYTPWTETYYIDEVSSGAERDNRKIRAGKSRGEKVSTKKVIEKCKENKISPPEMFKEASKKGLLGVFR